MNAPDLIEIEYTLDKKLSFIEPYITEWDEVNSSDLIQLCSYLQNEFSNFQRVLLSDTSNTNVAPIIKDIYYLLKKFTHWYISQETTIDNEHSDKSELVRNAIMLVEVLWVAYINEVYPQSDDSGELLTAEERMQMVKELRQDNERDNDEKSLMLLFSGSERQEKIKRIEILQTLLNDTKGREAARYLEAAIQLGWLFKTPSFGLLQKYFGVKGTQGAISKYYSLSGGSMFLEDEIENSKSELVYKSENWQHGKIK